MFLKKGLFLTKIIRNQITRTITQLPNASKSPYKEEKIIIKNYEINYLQVGHGPHHVLCAPGSLGSIWTDFKPQIKGFDQNKFSLTIVDPPGYGRSKKLSEDITRDLFRNYSYIMYHFMESLQIPRYSYLGWSSGGVAGLIHAALYPDVVNKLVVWGVGSFFYQHEMDQYKKMGDVNNWSESAVNALKEMHGEGYVQLVRDWAERTIACKDICIVGLVVEDVRCPTLILQGAKDPIVDKSHGPDLLKKIKSSRLHVYPEGKHNIHIRYAEDFNQRVQEFLLEYQKEFDF